MVRGPAYRAGRARVGRGVLGSGFALVLGAALAGCARAAPPSRFPDAATLISAMRRTTECSRGVSGEAKIDYFGEQGRVKGSMLFVAARPDRMRFDVLSPFGVMVSTLTSDGSHFSLLDVRTKQFFEGPALECNVRRFIRVPVPPFALVDLLSGEAPVLVHAPEDATLSWDSGAYLIRIRSRYGASEEIRLEPRPADWNLPFDRQRVRVLEVGVAQRGIGLYRAELEQFRAGQTAPPRTDPDGIDPDVPPSGPSCAAEIPRHVRIVSDAAGEDVVIDYRDVEHNPPLEPGVFSQPTPPGVHLRAAICR